MKTSAWANTMFVGVSTVSTSLRLAYITQPYINTLLTKAFMSYNLTLTLEIPNNLQFVRTA